MEEVMSVSENVHKRKGRKKLLYQKLINQMEFYFSAANLSKDRWLMQKLEEENEVHLSEFLRFNKIRSVTQDLNDLVGAVKKSKILAISDDLKVKRIEPIKFKENEDDYIIYVEQVPPDADHEWLSNHFSKFGEVDYISVPKFKKNGRCKGFAFIEFAEVEFAQKAIEEYKKNGNYLPAATEPAELISITTFEESKNEEQAEQSKSNEKTTSETTSVCEIDTETITKEETELSEENKSSKKRRKSDTCEVSEEKKIKLENLEEKETESNEADNTAKLEDGNTEKDGESEAMPVEESIDEAQEKKHKKNKSKKNKVDVYSGLTILSKKDWKKLRNKYLNTQKERMSKLKKLIYLQKQADLSKRNNKISQKHKNEEVKEKNKKANKLPFSPGLIVKGRLDDPVIEIQNFKSDMKKNKSLVFVDVKEGDTVVYLRFSSSDAASEFCKDSSWPKTKILKGDKESEYWNKVEADRAAKFNKPARKKNSRGKDRILKQAGKILGKHIKFD